jgi:hypothetical protein
VRKIPTLFERDFDNDPRHVLRTVTPGCEWVLAGEGKATRKYDGTCVMLDNAGEWWARREVKPGKSPPPGFVAADTDTATGKTTGWEPIAQSSFAKFHAEALANLHAWIPGTYELCGPKINGNPENFDKHVLIAHIDAEVLEVPDLSYEGLRRRLEPREGFGFIEGIVWHHPDGRMAKLKVRDFPAAASRAWAA